MICVRCLNGVDGNNCAWYEAGSFLEAFLISWIDVCTQLPRIRLLAPQDIISCLVQQHAFLGIFYKELVDGQLIGFQFFLGVAATRFIELINFHRFTDNFSFLIVEWRSRRIQKKPAIFQFSFNLHLLTHPKHSPPPFIFKYLCFVLRKLYKEKTVLSTAERIDFKSRFKRFSFFDFCVNILTEYTAEEKLVVCV